MPGLSKIILEKYYVENKYTVSKIAGMLACSEHKVNYWLYKYGIPKRSISEAIYTLRNPEGDPFTVSTITSNNQSFLYGLGLGLYWGEGTKANKLSVRLGNSDPKLIRAFIVFLKQCYKIKESKLKYGLQVFKIDSVQEAIHFWLKSLPAKREQFHKVTVTPTRGKGTYRRKMPHGVLTVYFHNKKLRDIICKTIENMQY